MRIYRMVEHIIADRDIYITARRLHSPHATPWYSPALIIILKCIEGYFSYLLHAVR